MRTLIIIILAFGSFTSFGQDKKKNFKYSIVFASCFSNDLVGLRVNKITLIDSKKISSDPIIGITQLGAYQDYKAVWVTDKNNKTSLPIIVISDTILLEIMFNGKWNKFSIDLQKGKIIFIDNCFEEGIREVKQKLTIKQFKKMPFLC